MVQTGFLIEGVQVVVECESTEQLLQFQQQHLPAEAASVAACEPCPRFLVQHCTGGLYQARRDGVPLESPTTLLRAQEQLANHLHLWVAEHCSKRVLLHAGAVGWGDQVLLLPGPSLAGKSTLVMALCQAGATYWSDDLAVVHGEGRTTAYSLPLSRRGTMGTERRVMPGPAPVGGVVRAVVFSQFTPEASDPLARRLSPATGLRELLRHAPALTRNPQQVLPILAELARRVTFHRLRRGEAGEAVDRLISLMSAASSSKGLS